MIFPFGMPFELSRVEVDLPQVADAIPLCFVIEVGRSRTTAFASGGYGSGSDSVAKFDHGDEAVPAVPVPLFGSGVGSCGEGGERSPLRGSEADRNAGGRIAEAWGDVVVQALEAVDVAPRCLPRAKVLGEFIRRICKPLKELVGRRSADFSYRNPFCAWTEMTSDFGPPEDC